MGETAAAVLAALPAAADDVVRATGLDAQTVAVALAELELAGLACEGDGLYRAAVAEPDSGVASAVCRPGG